ncbi:hypothetical protein HPP92_004167 [Vanilla planifolia]|uniref:Chloride conductance regulatory protein ICln n=1 Tax=Vanilla planifolia TaxID=51239 RepID=A0A835S4C8_VANPL|nr:hypothetical protein HPP92_004167 [Vanilla planifolia]
MVLGLQRLTEQDIEASGHPCLDVAGGEDLVHVQRDVAIVLGDRLPESPGTLYISSRRVMWLSDVNRGKGYAVDFFSISLHAVSRDPEAYPSPCIYIQIEANAFEDDESECSDTEFAEDSDLSRVTEMRLVPSDSNQLNTLFDIFCQCAELNPEPEGDDESGWFFGDPGLPDDGDQNEWQLSEELANPIGYANGNHDLAHSVLQLQIDDQRFEDAQEMEDHPHHEPN